MDGNTANMGKLAQKINDVAAEIGSVAEDGTNTFSNYKFISHQQLSAFLAPALKKHKLAILPSVIGEREEHFDAKGKRTTRTLVEMVFTVVDCETGFSKDFRFSGADQDTGGKSLAQAITEAQKRFEFKLFHITSKDDVDPDSRTNRIPEDAQRVANDAKRVFGSGTTATHKAIPAKEIFQKAMRRAGHDLYKLNDECKAKWEKGIGELTEAEMKAIAETKGVKVEL